MAKNNNKPPKVEAPVVEKPAEEKKTPADTTVITAGKPTKGLTQSEKVQYATELRYLVHDLKEEENPPVQLIAGYNMIRNATILDIAVGEIACGSSAMGFIFSGNEAAYNALKLAANSLGVKIPEFKSLPAPTAAQLKAVGLESVGNQPKLVTIDTKSVSAEAKKKKKEEKKLNDEAESGNKEYLTDPTKIKTEDELKEALGFQLVNSKIASPADRLITTAQFYRSYLEINAEKANDPQAELAKIHAYTNAELLQDISTMVPPSFTAEGFGKLLCNRVSATKSVVPAYELFKRCFKNRKTGKYSFTDEDIAAMVRVLIVWKASAKIASLSKDLSILSKDAEKNAKAIEQTNANIAEEQSLISMVTNPSYDVADQFIAAYNDGKHEFHKTAVEIYKSVIETYYKGVEVPELEFETMLLNVQQHAGIDLNLFNESVLRRDEYDEKNLIEIKSEEKPAEEESKNQ